MKLASVTAEVMNIAAMVRKGDDAAWEGIGPDAREHLVAELRKFSDVARQSGEVTGPVDLAAAATAATALAEELVQTGVPVSERAQDLASDMLRKLGISEDILNAIDGA